MKVDICDKQNKKVDVMDLSDRIFNAKWNPDLIHQALTVQLSNRRQPLAHAKGRGEVSGGGKKPWKQKGTGRSRHGSIRSPIWIGGGVSHGPKKERDFSRKINKKMKRLAVFSVLSKKIKDGEFKFIDSFNPESSKTKEMANILKNIFGSRLNCLLIASSANRRIKQAVSNVKNVDAISSKSLNVYDLLRRKYIIVEKEAIKEIESYEYFK
ncbi:50S ribosomal protein L4 [Candidatus Wolfebacteria bacterium]|nr:50S ribosomal protein L4 [Candidatus Wolfebacteria bacterium]